MEEGFPTSPSKRRRTMSPEEEQSRAEVAASEPALTTATINDVEPTNSMSEAIVAVEPRTSAFLDVLMEQVEAEIAPAPAHGQATAPSQAVQLEHAPEPLRQEAQPPLPQEPEHTLPEVTGPTLPQKTVSTLPDPGLSTDSQMKPNEAEIKSEGSGQPSSLTAGIDDIVLITDTAVAKSDQAKVDGEPPAVESSSEPMALDSKPSTTADMPAPATLEPSTAAGADAEQHSDQTAQPTELVTAPGPSDEPREWETDSSYDSSDSDSTSTDSDDDSDDSDEDAGEYSLLDPEEQARILMQDDGGSDDEVGKGKERGNATVRTANERMEEVIHKPNIEVTEDMKIEVLGSVEAIVESTVVVKAKTSGEYQVLESGSLLCLKDRSVLGVIAETIGRVEHPMYTIRFTNDQAIEEAGLSEHGTVVHYVVPHSTFVFTQPLKAVKGSDASNFHDEEIGDEEMEFSDDEKEAEHKRQLKLRRQGRLGRDDGGPGRGGGGGRGRGRGRGDYTSSHLRHSSLASSEPNPTDDTNGPLNYDDKPDDGYTPLRRPSQEQSPPNRPPMTTDANRGGGYQNRGRGGFRGEGRGRGRGRGRGSYDNYNRHQGQNQNQNQSQNHYQQNHNQQNQQMQMPPPPPFNIHSNFNFSSQSQPQQTPTPQITPQVPPPFAPFSPSPISPLPGQQFNFGQFTGFPPPPPPSMGGMQNQSQNWSWQGPNLNQPVAAQVQQHLAELMRAQREGQQGQQGQQGKGGGYAGQGYQGQHGYDGQQGYGGNGGNGSGSRRP